MKQCRSTVGIQVKYETTSSTYRYQLIVEISLSAGLGREWPRCEFHIWSWRGLQIPQQTRPWPHMQSPPGPFSSYFVNYSKAAVWLDHLALFCRYLTFSSQVVEDGYEFFAKRQLVSLQHKLIQNSNSVTPWIQDISDTVCWHICSRWPCSLRPTTAGSLTMLAAWCPLMRPSCAPSRWTSLRRSCTLCD